jgi:hypothetical protein
MRKQRDAVVLQGLGSGAWLVRIHTETDTVKLACGQGVKQSGFINETSPADQHEHGGLDNHLAVSTRTLPFFILSSCALPIRFLLFALV